MTNIRKPIFIFVKDVSHLKHLVDPLSLFLKGLRHEVFVLHISKLQGRDYNFENKHEDRYELFDISYKSHKEISDFFIRYQPCILLVINFRSLFDLYINRTARLFGTKTIFMDHGFWAAHSVLKFRMTNKLESVKRYTRFVCIYIQFLCAGMMKKGFLREIAIFWNVMFKNNYKDANYDFYLFYAQYGCDQMRRFFKFFDDRLFFSGYPIVSHNSELSSLQINMAQPKNKKIIFIHQPFIIDKESDITYEIERKYLFDINKLCQNNGFELLVYIHPRESKIEYEKRFVNSGICFEQENRLLESVKESALVFGFYSTALFYAIFFKKPIFILPYPGFKSPSCLDYFAQVGIKITNISDLQSSLSTNESYCQKLSNYEDFRRMYIGENNSYEHQAAVIDEIYKTV